jgi:hypothetical protein
VNTIHAAGAQDVSDFLTKALPAASPMVDHYRHLAVWDQAIIEALIVFADSRQPLPTDIRQMVEEFISQPGVGSRLRRHAGYFLAQIPTSSD